MTTKLLFVYGSLQEGLRNHELLARIKAEKLGDATIQGQLLVGSYGGEIPCIRPSQEVGALVIGELYQLNDPSSDLVVLDHLEGLGKGFYVRRKTQVLFNNEPTVWAWAYWAGSALPREKETRIENGNYREWVASQKEGA